jgi:low temperature requirement protein LtrA
VAALFVPLGAALGLGGAGLVFEAGAMVAPVHLAPHGGYLSERNGLFTMIVLGEGVISLVLPGIDRRDVSWEHYIVVVVIGFWLLFNLQLAIFDTFPTEAHLERLNDSFVRVRLVSAFYAVLGMHGAIMTSSGAWQSPRNAVPR